MNILKGSIETEDMMTVLLHSFNKFISQQGRGTSFMRTAGDNNNVLLAVSSLRSCLCYRISFWYRLCIQHIDSGTAGEYSAEACYGNLDKISSVHSKFLLTKT